MSYCITFRLKASALQLCRQLKMREPDQEFLRRIRFAFPGKASPALEQREAAYLSPSVLEREAGLRGPVSSCNFLWPNVLAFTPIASRVSRDGKNDSVSLHLLEAPADMETGWRRQQWKV